jgi:hypothetical protein
MMSRRNFLVGAATGACSISKVWATKNSASPFPFDEFEQRIARRDFRGITKDVLHTPCMVVDIDVFQGKIVRIAETFK